MHDRVQPGDTNLLRWLLHRVDALERELSQLRRVRHPNTQNPRHGPVFAAFNSTLIHGGTATVERIVRTADDSDWERSGETFEVTDLFLNLDDTVEPRTICTVVHYEGKEVPDSIYCRPSDWLPDPP